MKSSYELLSNDQEASQINQSTSSNEEPHWCGIPSSERKNIFYWNQDV